MTPANIEELHAAAVAILERTGLNVHHAGMRAQLAAAGAKDYSARARAYARQMVASHRPAELDSQLDSQLRELCNWRA